MSRRWVVTIAAFVASGAGSAVATAQPAARTGEAEQLFRDGQALVKSGKLAEACQAFEGSQRLEPNPVTLMNLADCRERNGELATAWALFLQSASALRNDPTMATIAQSARQKAAALEPRLSHLIINVPDESRLGLAIARNGVAVDPAAWNRAMPIDGGTYTIVAKAPDHEAWSAEITVGRELDKKSVDVPRLKDLPQVTAPMQASDVEPPGREASGGLTGRRKLAIGVGAVGLASLGAAAAFELSGQSGIAEYRRAAPDDPGKETLYQDANRKHQLAQGLAIAGLVGAGAATFLWVTGGPTRADRAALRPVVAPSFTGVALAGGF